MEKPGLLLALHPKCPARPATMRGVTLNSSCLASASWCGMPALSATRPSACVIAPLRPWPRARPPPTRRKHACAHPLPRLPPGCLARLRSHWLSLYIHSRCTDDKVRLSSRGAMHGENVPPSCCAQSDTARPLTCKCRHTHCLCAVSTTPRTAAPPGGVRPCPTASALQLVGRRQPAGARAVGAHALLRSALDRLLKRFTAPLLPCCAGVCASYKDVVATNQAWAGSRAIATSTADSNGAIYSLGGTGAGYYSAVSTTVSRCLLAGGGHDVGGLMHRQGGGGGLSMWCCGRQSQPIPGKLHGAACMGRSATPACLPPHAIQCFVASCTAYDPTDSCLCQTCATGFTLSTDKMGCVSDCRRCLPPGPAARTAWGRAS